MARGKHQQQAPVGDTGLSLRDYLAGCFLAGRAGLPWPAQNLEGDQRDPKGAVARAAYEYADALIEAREAPPAGPPAESAPAPQGYPGWVPPDRPAGPAARESQLA